MRAGDVILGVGTSDVADVKQFEAAARPARQGARLAGDGPARRLGIAS